MSGRYNQPVQYGVCMRERQHIYEDLNESSSASPGGSQQLEIPPSPNSKRAANIFQIRWYFTRRGDFNALQDSIVRLYFCQTPTFCKSTYVSGKRQHFLNLPIFWRSANILGIRQYVWNPPIFWKSADIFQIRLLFCKAPIFYGFAWFCCYEYLCIFSVFILCI